MHIDHDILGRDIRIEYAEDVHQNPIEVHGALGEVPCPKHEDRPAARVGSRAVEELHGFDVA